MSPREITEGLSRRRAHTLTSLIEKGMVRPSLDSPTMYIVEDLDTALQAALKKRESELRWMEARTRELQELAKQQGF